MKGIVFTEFLEMVSGRFGEDAVDDIIEECELATGGAYTSVGTYDHRELVSLVQALSSRTGLPAPALVRAFGVYLFPRFATLYPRFFESTTGAFEFLSGIEQVIHAEVRKLYPDAELPRFEIERHISSELQMVYTSKHRFAELAEGLIEGCLSHFGETANITRENLPDSDGATRVRFSLRRHVTATA